MAWDTGLDKKGVSYKIAAAPQKRIRVIAGPGTGKSYAMKRRVARLLEEGVSPKSLLAVTFTRVAAEDLHRELQKLGVAGCDELRGQTLHSLAMKILARKHVLEALGRTPRPLNKYEVAVLICDLAESNGGRRAVKGMITGYTSAWAQSQGDEPGFAKTVAEKQFQAGLLNWLEFHQSMLIGELIPYLVKFLRDNPAVKEHTEFTHLLVDEFQDLNKAEQTAISYLGQKAAICIVGDDDQSIYSFKNAHPDGIRQWKSDNKGCIDLALSECHRCPTTVVKMVNDLIAVNKHREQRSLLPLADKGPGEISIVQLKNLSYEAAWVSETIKKILDSGIHPSEIIILVQRSIVSRPIFDALKSAGIPVKSYYDESQLDSLQAQERFSLLKLLINEEDRVALRFLLGYGVESFRSKPYERVRLYCESSGDSPWVAMQKLRAKAIRIPHTTSLVEQFDVILGELDALNAVRHRLNELVDTLFPSNAPQLSELRELALAQLSESDTPEDLFSGMIQELTQPDVAPAVEEVRIMSLHKSKGLSSPYVFICGCVEGILPSAPDLTLPKSVNDSKLEEARRLFYVGVTRVKADPTQGRAGNLYITYSQQMPVKDAYGANIQFKTSSGTMANLLPSRFIGELGSHAPKPTSG